MKRRQPLTACEVWKKHLPPVSLSILTFAPDLSFEDRACSQKNMTAMQSNWYIGRYHPYYSKHDPAQKQCSYILLFNHNISVGGHHVYLCTTNRSANHCHEHLTNQIESSFLAVNEKLWILDTQIDWHVTWLLSRCCLSHVVSSSNFDWLQWSSAKMSETRQRLVQFKTINRKMLKVGWVLFSRSCGFFFLLLFSLCFLFFLDDFNKFIYLIWL